MGYTSLTLNQNNWVASKLSDGTIFTVNDINDINNGLDGPTTIVNGNLTTILTHTFILDPEILHPSYLALFHEAMSKRLSSNSTL